MNSVCFLVGNLVPLKFLHVALVAFRSLKYESEMIQTSMLALLTVSVSKAQVLW